MYSFGFAFANKLPFYIAAAEKEKKYIKNQQTHWCDGVNAKREAHNHTVVDSLSTISRLKIKKSVADNRSNSEQATSNTKNEFVRRSGEFCFHFKEKNCHFC